MFKIFSGVITRSSLFTHVANPLLRRGLASKTIYVSNVSYNSTEQGLEELGSRFGKVESVRMPRDYEGRSRGYGFIEFSQEEDATKAMEGLNGILFEGRELRVAEARGPNTNTWERRPRYDDDQ
ncbi:13752_t:CDS:2 [Acaulospora morrowiae]|uniref:13752_t:CDS:1 n=1 Tax=Acaulospora morrowiae TaxID=94023 RepID=A0A9N9CAA4_9GLOM|nr:13752_t:CDS:2 [Acaulospora morrowiae]